MKCLPQCGFKVKPDNISALTSHLEECMFSGPCSKLPKEPVVIWKDGEFTVVPKATKKDTVFPVEVKKREVIHPSQLKVKLEKEAAPKKPSVSRGGITQEGGTKIRSSDLKMPDEIQGI